MRRICRGPGVACLVLLAAHSPSAFAASQGELGATSSGSITIRVSVAGQVQLSGLSDVYFASQSVSAGATSSQDLCVWSNSLTGGFDVTANGDGPQGAFVIGGAAATAPYSVQWTSNSGTQPSVPLTPGVPLDMQTTAMRRQDCNTDPGAASKLTVSMSENPAAMTSGTPLTGVLDLVVAPQ